MAGLKNLKLVDCYRERREQRYQLYRDVHDPYSNTTLVMRASKKFPLMHIEIW